MIMDGSVPGVRARDATAGVAAERRTLLFAAVLALVLTGALFLLERRLDFYIAEEGFLWYGAAQTAHGAVPLRDFYAYDPGRYVWAAPWMWAFGDGLLGLRLAMAVFQALGLFCGLLAASRVVAERWKLALVGALLLLWMVPRNKLFEPALLLFAVFAAVLLIEKPTLRRHFGAGVLVGLAAFFGKNHGLYLLLAFLLLIPFVWVAGERSGPRELFRRLFVWGCGILAGLTPLWVMFAVAPGFFTAYIDSIRFFLAQGQTNFPLPVPWPWRAEQNARLFADRAFDFGLGVGFLLMPLVYGAAVLTALFSRGEVLRRRALLTACGFIGLFYMHHAFSRADIHHLMPASPPLLLALVALLASLPAGASLRHLRRGVLAVAVTGLAALTFLLAVRTRPLYADFASRGTADAFEPARVAGDLLWLNRHQAALLRHVERTAEAWMRPGEPVLIAPDQPGLYAVLGRRAPVWDIYTLWPDRNGLDERMLREIKARGVRWVVVRDLPTMDGKDALCFSRVRPRVWAYLSQEFERIPPQRLSLPMDVLLLHKISDGGAAVEPRAVPQDVEAQSGRAHLGRWRRRGRSR
jgi:hypothetical protein